MLYGGQQRMCCHLTMIRGYYNDDDATMRILRQSCVLSQAINVPVDPSVQQPNTNFTYEI
jgi:hypothetical protein